MSDCNAALFPITPGTNLFISHTDPDLEDITPIQKLVGCLLYFSSTPGPNLVYSAGLLSRHMHAPKMAHWKSANDVLLYLNGTRKLCTCYETGGSSKLSAHSDSDTGQEQPHAKSINGFCFLFSKGTV